MAGYRLIANDSVAAEEFISGGYSRGHMRWKKIFRAEYKLSASVTPISGQHLRRWASIGPISSQHMESPAAISVGNMYFVRIVKPELVSPVARADVWANVFDVDPTLDQCLTSVVLG